MTLAVNKNEADLNIYLVAGATLKKLNKFS